MSVTVTATTPKGMSNHLIFTIIVLPAPKATSWGPVFGATFTFVIKATGQLGPSFSFDRSKAGSSTLFSMVRTETNYVNIVMTSTDVPLVEVDAAGNVKGTGRPLAVGNIDLIDKAMKRLDDTLLKLNNAQIGLATQ